MNYAIEIKDVNVVLPGFQLENINLRIPKGAVTGLIGRKVPAQYSKGMQMKFMLAMVLARDPDILILDEPTAGMDPAARAELMALIQEFMVDEEKTVIFSTHITSDLDKIADYIALIGVKENTFGFTGLTKDRNGLEQLQGVRLARPNIEDLLIYGDGNG